MKPRKIGSNMYELDTDKAVVLLSYQTPVACRLKSDGACFRTEQWYSSTTSRHINKWLRGSLALEMSQRFFNEMAE